MAVNALQSTVGTTATPLFGSATATTALVTNNGPDTVWLGPSTVTVGNGYPLPAEETRSVQMKASDTLYAIAAVAGNTVSWLYSG